MSLGNFGAAFKIIIRNSTCVQTEKYTYRTMNPNVTKALNVQVADGKEVKVLHRAEMVRGKLNQSAFIEEELPIWKYRGDQVE